MAFEHEMRLDAGQRTNVDARASRHGYLYCLEGSAHLASSHMGVGWTMIAGDGCLLRTPMHYRIVARTAARLLFKPVVKEST